MTPHGKSDGAPRVAARGALESPFLEGEHFVEESVAERRAGALPNVDSPFLSAFEGRAEPVAAASEDELDDEVDSELGAEFELEADLDHEAGFEEGGEEDPLEPEAALEAAHDEEMDGVEGEEEALLEEAADLPDEEDLLGWERWEGPEEEADPDGWAAPGAADAFELEFEFEVDDGLDEEATVEDEAGRGVLAPEWEAPVATPAGRAVIVRVPLLRRHRGVGPDLVLAWNEIVGRPPSVDVVVHLHGYSLRRGSRLHLVKDLAARSGLDWADPAGADRRPGRTRPTLAILPRGHFFGGKTGRGHSFPALVTKEGLRTLVEYGLESLARRIGATALAPRRVVVTAHSGGGAALMAILRHNDPDEVHVFDGLYQDPAALVAWARKRIERDRAALAAAGVPVARHMADSGGGLRVLYRPGTGTQSHSLAAHRALEAALPAGSELRRWYRVERTSVGHVQIPRSFGWRLLADVSAELPGTSPPPPAPRRELFLGEGAFSFGDGPPSALEAPAPDRLAFPSGESLPVLAGMPEGKGEDYWDPTGSGNPLLDTGPAHKDTRLSANFTVRELTTTGGKSADVARIDPRFVEALQRLRDHLGRGITVTSGYRSWKRNKQVYAKRKNPDGTKKEPTLSQHCGGRAGDVKVQGMDGLEIAKAAIEACGPDIGVGLAKTFAHIDLRGYAEVWDYGSSPDAWVSEIRRLQRAKGGRGRPRGSAVPTVPKKAGPSAELVRFAQRVLNAAEGERLADDGDLGRLTRAALARFRARYGLGAGGVLDARTELALVQRALEEIALQSIFGQPGARDGRTDAAIAGFRARNGLGTGATLDAALRAALTDALGPRTAPRSPT